MVYVHLSDEEKLQVLLVALAIFLAAVLAAVCLAGVHCPLHRWMLERHLRRRRRHQPELQFAGPPPAYDAALRAARLQPFAGPKDELGAEAGADQLQLGDYFHQPRDEQLLVPAEGRSPEGAALRCAPVMLRLWLRLLEPGELLERARAPKAVEMAERKCSLSRQLSIPQLFGSIVGLAQLAPKTSSIEQPQVAPGTSCEPNSLASTGSSSTGSNGPADLPVESRVLHMNVGSFSYAQEGGVVSAKKHAELNRLHFGPDRKDEAAPAGKFCQLVISVCDIENVIAAGRLGERSCALLAASSSVYVRCELVLNKSKSARLLAYPLRALQTGPPTHTVELSAGGATSSAADSQASLVFATLPKSLASSGEQALEPDLVQLDSVFVSPILHRSRLLDGHVRLRVYSQCKHLNETCLAEVKLSLKQLLRGDSNDNLADVSPQPQQHADLVLNNVLANLESAVSGEPLAETLGEQAETLSEAQQRPGWALDGAPLHASSSLDGSLDRLNWLESVSGQQRRLAMHQERMALVSHWLSHLLAPAYECRPIEEPCGRVLLGITYLPTSNRVVFNAHRATFDNEPALGRQLLKNLRLRSSTGYLLRFLMVLNGRVTRRKQTVVAKRPEWDSQEPITFDLVNLGAEQPSFVVALVARDASDGQAPFGSLQNLRGRAEQLAAGRVAQSEPESARPWPPAHDWSGRRRRDLVVGHATLAEEIWRELRAQPRKQLVRQLKLY